MNISFYISYMTEKQEDNIRRQIILYKSMKGSFPTTTGTSQFFALSSTTSFQPHILDQPKALA